jgi:hypothetical protein
MGDDAEDVMVLFDEIGRDGRDDDSHGATPVRKGEGV